jgi:hypothetical protein
MSSDPTDETRAVAERYARRAAPGRYSMLQPDVWQTVQERQRAMLRLFVQQGLTDLSTLRVLEVGCGAGGNLLESYDLSAVAPIPTPNGINDGAFRGVRRASADIRFFEIDGSFLLVGDLTTADPGTSVVPVPASLPLMATGLVALFALQRRRAR